MNFWYSRPWLWLRKGLERCRLGRFSSNTATSAHHASTPAGPVASSSGERANAAYHRALQAFEQRAYDVARSWALHALNEDPQHAGARALLTRVDAARPSASPFEPQTSTTTSAGGGSYGGSPRKGPEPISVDPNVLISRASGSEASEPIEPTMIIQRDDPRLRLAGSRVRPPAPPPPLPYTPEPPVAEPTVIVQPNQRAAYGARSSAARTSGARSSNAAASGGPSLWQRLRPGGNRSQSPRPPSPTGRVGTTSDRRPEMWAPWLRGALIAIAAVAVASLVVWGAILGWGWLWPDGERLKITKPVGGTITGHGLRCGTLGSDCSTTLPTGDRVQLEATADADYVYSGFNGDCSPTGVSLMSEPRTCGATFDAVTAPPPTATFTLTITKPTGGTVVGPMDILCGPLGVDVCSSIPEWGAGQPALRSRAGPHVFAVHRRVRGERRDHDDRGTDVQRDVHGDHDDQGERPAFRVA